MLVVLFSLRRRTLRESNMFILCVSSSRIFITVYACSICLNNYFFVSRSVGINFLLVVSVSSVF